MERLNKVVLEPILFTISFKISLFARFILLNSMYKSSLIVLNLNIKSKYNELSSLQFDFKYFLKIDSNSRSNNDNLCDHICRLIFIGNCR